MHQFSPDAPEHRSAQLVWVHLACAGATSDELYVTDMSGTLSLFQSSGGASPDIYIDQIFIYLTLYSRERDCGSFHMAVGGICLNTSAKPLLCEMNSLHRGTASGYSLLTITLHSNVLLHARSPTPHSRHTLLALTLTLTLKARSSQPPHAPHANPNTNTKSPLLTAATRSSR